MCDPMMADEAEMAVVHKKKEVKTSCTDSIKNQIKTRFVYKLWDLHKSSTFAMSKQEQRNLRVLTRTRIDGKLQHRDYNKECLSDVVCLSSRLEFQPEYGVFVVEPKELIREYVDLYLRSHAKLCRVRCVGHTQEVMMTEVKTLQEVRECMLAQKEKIDPKAVFDPLYAVLTHLVDQPAGHYLLRHTPRMGSFAQLLPAAGDQRESLFRLSHEYSSMKESDVGVPPRQIDLYTVTAIHSRDRTLPGLFKPMPDVDNRKHLKKPTAQIPPKIKMSGSQRKKIRRMKAQIANELKQTPDLKSMSISQATKP